MMHSLNSSREKSGKTKVLLVITRLTVGGDTNVVLDIASHFSEHPDFEASLAVGPVPEVETDLTHLAYDRGIPTVLVPSLVNRINPLQNVAAVRQLRSIIAHGKYDIVHTHSSVAGVVGRIAAMSARTPVIVHHVHGWGLREDMSAGTRLLYLDLERLCARFTSRMIAVSEPTIQKGIDLHVCRREKFALIYNGIHLDKFSRQVDREAVLRNLGLDPSCRIVGMIGRLDKQKNPLDFIRAAALVAKDYPKVQFLVAGDGCLRPECEELIDQLALQGKLVLLGFRNDIDEILPAIDIAALTSLWEGLPVVFQEAMSAGKPMVANNVDGVRDVVIDGETGYLVRPHHPEETAGCILQLLNDDQLRNRLGSTAQLKSKAFSSDQMLRNIELLYRELLDAKSSHRREAVRPRQVRARSSSNIHGMM